MNFKNLSLIQTCNFNLTDFLKLRKLYYELLNKISQNHKSKNIEEESLVSASKCCPKIKPPPSPRANSHSPEALVFQKFIPLPRPPSRKGGGGGRHYDCFQLKISSVNVTKSAVSCGFGHIS